MYWSAAVMGEVPRPVVTRTSTVPVPAGAMALIEPSELSTKLVAGVEPKVTALTLAKLVPLIITCVPPPVGPPAGLDVVVTPVTVGASM